MTFKYQPLGKLVKFHSGGTPKKTNPDFWNGNIPWISAKTMKEEHISTSDLFISEEGLKAGSKLAPKDSILLLTRGSGLFKDIPICLVDEPVAFNQDVKCLTSCSEVEIKYIFYWLLANKPFLIAKVDVTGIGAGKFDMDFLENLQVPVLRLEDRQRIISILDSISEKISLNQKINDNLERQAQAIIENYCASVQETIDLGDVLSFANGFAFKSSSYLSRGTYKIITIKNVQDGMIDSQGVAYLNKIPPKMKPECFLHSGDVLLSLTGNVGRVGIVCEDKLLLNQRVAKLVPSNMDLLPFFYFFFRQPSTKVSMEMISKGTAQQNLSPVETLKLKIPYDSAALVISSTLNPLFKEIIANVKQNKRLLGIRNAILPKLMSGEIDVEGIRL